MPKRYQNQENINSLAYDGLEDPELEAIIARGRNIGRKLADEMTQYTQADEEVSDYDPEELAQELLDRVVRRTTGVHWKQKLDSGAWVDLRLIEDPYEKLMPDSGNRQASGLPNRAVTNRKDSVGKIAAIRAGAVGLITAGLLAGGAMVDNTKASADNSDPLVGAESFESVTEKGALESGLEYEKYTEYPNMDVEMLDRPFVYRVSGPVNAVAIAWDVGIDKASLVSANPNISMDTIVPAGTVLEGEVTVSKVVLSEPVDIRDVASNYGLSEDAVQSVNYVSEEGWIKDELFIPGRIIIPIAKDEQADYSKLVSELGLNETGAKELIRINQRRLNNQGEELPLPDHVAVANLSVYPLSVDLLDVEKIAEAISVPSQDDAPRPISPVDQPVAVTPQRDKYDDESDVIDEDRTVDTKDGKSMDGFDISDVNEEDWIYEDDAKELFSEKSSTDERVIDSANGSTSDDFEVRHDGTTDMVPDTISESDDSTPAEIDTNTNSEVNTEDAQSPSTTVPETVSPTMATGVAETEVMVRVERQATPEEKAAAEVEAMHAALDHMIKSGGDVGPLNHIVANSPLFKGYGLPQELQDQGFRYLPPASALGLNYEFSTNTPDNERYSHYTNITTILAAAYTVEIAKQENPIIYGEYPNACLRVGDLSALKGHATHNGNSVDLSSAMMCDIENGRAATDGPVFWISRDTSSKSSRVTNPNHSPELENLVLFMLNALHIDGKPLVKSVLYNRDVSSIASKLRPDFVKSWINHSNHVHVTTNGITSADMKAFGVGGGRIEKDPRSWILRVYAEYQNGGGVDGIGKNMMVTDEVLQTDLQTWIEGVASDQFSAEAHVTPGSDPAPVEMANVPEQPPVSSADSALPIVDTPTEVPIEVATESEINYEALAAMQREILPVTAGIPEEFREIIKPSKYFSAIQIAAQIKTESNFDPNAKSGAGAMGLSQFMPETWPEVARQHPEQTNPAATRSDPQESVVRQRLYMDDLHERILKYLAEGRIYGDPVDLTLAAYNAGMGNVLKARGVPNFTETKNYIKRNKQTVAEFVFLVAAENS
ncbi:lytic transglycosylase domain-containing protein [Candidatus Saccharibacteria bacterium]|nr:lytic transglycosylase domain-containing protein [Candidatus Saccharibacteria bacterium]